MLTRIDTNIFLQAVKVSLSKIVNPKLAPWCVKVVKRFERSVDWKSANRKASPLKTKLPSTTSEKFAPFHFYNEEMIEYISIE